MPFQMPRTASRGAVGVGVPQVRGIGQGQEVNRETMAAIQRFSDQIKAKRLAEQEQARLSAESDARSILMKRLGLDRIEGSSVEQQQERIKSKEAENAYNRKMEDQREALSESNKRKDRLTNEKRMYEAEKYAIAQRDRERLARERNETTMGAARVTAPPNPLQKEYLQDEGKGIIPSFDSAQDQKKIMLDSEKSLDFIDKGIKSGPLANFRVGLGKYLKGIGFNASDDEIENTEAFFANQVKLLEPHIAAQGRGFTDQDRQMFQQATAGDITLDENSMRTILNLTIKGAKWEIDRHNERMEGLKKGGLLKPARKLTIDVPRIKKRGGLEGMLGGGNKKPKILSFERIE